MACISAWGISPTPFGTSIVPLHFPCATSILVTAYSAWSADGGCISANKAISEATLEHLARGVTRQRIYKFNAAGYLEFSELAQAVANYDLYNQKFAALLKQELTPESMHEIHMLSYTLENALETMAAELSQHRDDLERVHKASETMKADQIIKFGNKYLDTSSTLRQ